jgi:hypothetical protein
MPLSKQHAGMKERFRYEETNWMTRIASKQFTKRIACYSEFELIAVAVPGGWISAEAWVLLRLGVRVTL